YPYTTLFRSRSRDRGRLLLRLREGRALHARGPREDRSGHARDREGRLSLRAPGDGPCGRRPLLPRARRALQGRDPRGDRRPARVALPPGGVHRPLPWAARTLDGPREALQAALVVGRLLARRRAEPDAPADLRDRVAHAGGARPPRLAPGGGEEARPPQARARAGPLYLQRGVAGSAVLAPSRLDLGARAGAVRPLGARRARLTGDLDTETRQHEDLLSVGPPVERTP